jgi:hypothetical protein
MIQPGPDGVSQVNGEELYAKKVIVCLACPASEAVVLQPDVGVSFTVVLDDDARRSEVLWEVSVVHGASEHFLPQLFRGEVASFVMVTTSVVRVWHVVLGLHIIILQQVLMEYLGLRPSAWMSQLVVGQNLCQ